ncbi:MAG: COX15/CtaA family protein [Actinomycetales bacterium]|nr:COX15/CtaA family protein [Actinomycetales bacterium]
MATPLKSWQMRVLWANLVAQTGIVVTGALVRVTSSGLGCPTWPECVEGSITPTSEQTESWHKYVEFGNRMLTAVLGVIALAAIFAVWQHNKARLAAGENKNRLLTKLSFGTLLGILAQAVLGGITVLTGLHPLTVAAHFLVSTILIAVAVLLVIRASQLEIHQPKAIAKPVRYLIQAITAVTFIIVVIGTLVTGTGPHAGDSADVPRLGFDPKTITHAHATAVQLFFGLVIGLIVAVFANESPKILARRAFIVLGVGLAQGAIGYIQYFTGLPWVLVALHVLGACLLWTSVLFLHFTTVKISQIETN